MVSKMKRRINISFFIIVLLCAVMLSASVSLIIYNVTRNREMAGIKDRAYMIAEILNSTGTQNIPLNFSYYDAEGTRITIISYDGTVLLDNKANPETLDNHSDREEFREALQTGRGESMRYSATLSTETYYYAIRLLNGDVLRISKTMDRVIGVFTNVLLSTAGVTILVLIIAAILASRLTKSIIDPLNKIDFDNKNSGVYDELIPFVRKINQQKSKIANQVKMLQSRADTIDTIISNMNEGLVLIDYSGIILSLNRSALGILGGNDLIGRNILHIYRDAEFQRGVNKCLSGKNNTLPIERDGKMYQVYFSPVKDYEITGGVIFFQDTSETYELEKQRREFTANVSHELKTPLTTITATAEMIEGEMIKDEDIKAFATKISTQAKRLISVIEDIIKLSEFDENSIKTENTEFILRELAESVVDSLQQKADEKGVSVEIKGELFAIKANKQMVDELLHNLIDNAIKYNKDDGMVVVLLSKEDDICKITVVDTGIGIEEKDQSRVFERFYRTDKSRSKKTGGTGLGLSIVKHITEHHKGSVTLTSTVDFGTTVECTLTCSG